MEEKRNLKALVPWIKEELAKGRNKEEVYEELNLNRGQRRNITVYLNRDEPIDDPLKYLIVRPPRKRPPEYVYYKGKRYRDVTADFIDCGG